MDQVEEYVRVRDGNSRGGDRRHGLLPWRQNLRFTVEILQAGLPKQVPEFFTTETDHLRQFGQLRPADLTSPERLQRQAQEPVPELVAGRLVIRLRQLQELG